MGHIQVSEKMRTGYAGGLVLRKKNQLGYLTQKKENLLEGNENDRDRVNS